MLTGLQFLSISVSPSCEPIVIQRRTPMPDEDQRTGIRWLFATFNELTLSWQGVVHFETFTAANGTFFIHWSASTFLTFPPNVLTFTIPSSVILLNSNSLGESCSTPQCNSVAQFYYGLFVVAKKGRSWSGGGLEEPSVNQEQLTKSLVYTTWSHSSRIMHGRARAPTPLYIPYQYCTYMLVLPDCCYKLNRSYRCSNIPFDIDAHQINIMYKCISMLSLHTKFTSISTDVTPSWGGYNICRYHGWCTFHEIEARAIPVQLLTSTLQQIRLQ